MFLKRYEDLSADGKGGKGGLDGAEGEAGKEISPEEKKQGLLEKKAGEFKKEEELRTLELIEYYRFPNILGWYFDGTFTSNFTLHEEYAEYFNEIEDELDAQKDLIIEETFTEKAYRNFWPPHFFAGGRYFRTRGIYLDFKEVREDPPKTPPNINYEKQRGIIGVETEFDPNELQESGRGIRFYSSTYGPSGFQSKRDNWYWNEDRREYRAKDVDGGE
ncbi:unnamed protein product [Orchesella dallaii]|uniref:Uncharacterized protein n=1 Tax=Orchesella dallaii TaxID=48710 RepID=A0ABP1QCA7_9HEXA